MGKIIGNPLGIYQPVKKLELRVPAFNDPAERGRMSYRNKRMKVTLAKVDSGKGKYHGRSTPND